jgi:predicted transposase YbfD/YdcC
LFFVFVTEILIQSDTSLSLIFSTLEDPRINRQKLHKLSDILVIAICGVICGADNWVAIEAFGQSKKSWFTKLLDLEHGIPSHDTFGKVFAAIDSEKFSECFIKWVSGMTTLFSGEVIAIDGKTVRRSADKAQNKKAIHMVSAWAQQNRLVLGQIKVDEKSNEITAIPKLLAQLDIVGAIVTTDAMGCQYRIMDQIVKQGGDAVLCLKGNQGSLNDDVRQWFENQPLDTQLNEHYNLDYDHGRIEQRTIKSNQDVGWLRTRHPKWENIQSILSVTAKRDLNGKISQETRYFISSLKDTCPEKLGQIVRAHWSVENELHWTLDVAFDEDQARTRKGHSAANMSILRHLTLNLLKQEKTEKVGIKIKRQKAGWNEAYLLKVLNSLI